MIKKLWGWAKSILFIGSDLIKVVKGQEEINQRLDEIEKAIKSPQYQVAELEKIKMNADLLKDYYGLEIKKLKAGSQEEIDKHKAKIEELTQKSGELAEYKKLLVEAIKIIKQKELEIKRLEEHVEQLIQKTPPSLLAQALAGGLGRPSPSELLINILTRRKLREEKNE